MSYETIDSMMGAVMSAVTEDGEALTFRAVDGRTFIFQHHQDCCESVRIEDVCGDLDDLVGAPIVLAEEVTNADEPKLEHEPDSYTWTFYRFATSKGTVTVRWFGESNGYYGEGVSFDVLHDAPLRSSSDGGRDGA